MLRMIFAVTMVVFTIVTITTGKHTVVITYINAFRTKLRKSLHVMYPGFGQDITRLKYFHRVT